MWNFFSLPVLHWSKNIKLQLEKEEEDKRLPCSNLVIAVGKEANGKLHIVMCIITKLYITPNCNEDCTAPYTKDRSHILQDTRKLHDCVCLSVNKLQNTSFDLGT